MTLRAPDFVVTPTGVPDFEVLDIPQDGLVLRWRAAIRSDTATSDGLRIEFNGDSDLTHYEAAHVQTGFGGYGVVDDFNAFGSVPGVAFDADLMAIIDAKIPLYAVDRMQGMRAAVEIGDNKSLASVGWLTLRWVPAVLQGIDRIRFFLEHGNYIAPTKFEFWRQ